MIARGGLEGNSAATMSNENFGVGWKPNLLDNFCLVGRVLNMKFDLDAGPTGSIAPKSWLGQHAKWLTGSVEGVEREDPN